MTLLFADVSISTEVAIGLIVSVVGCLAGAVAMLFRALMTQKDLALAKMEAEHAAEEEKMRAARQLEADKNAKKSYEEMLKEAMEIVKDKVSSEKGVSVAAMVVPVVPEHRSPVTREQQETADLQTARAELTAAKLALGLPAREAGTPETEAQAQARVAKEKLPPRLTNEPVVEHASHQSAVESAAIDKLKSDVKTLKDGQIRADIAAVKADVAKIPDKTAEAIKKDEQRPS